jgi:hypothetical protein
MDPILATRSRLRRWKREVLVMRLQQRWIESIDKGKGMPRAVLLVPNMQTSYQLCSSEELHHMCPKFEEYCLAIPM